MEENDTLTDNEIQTAYTVLETVRDHYEETGLVHEGTTLNEAHSLIQVYQEDMNE